MTLFDLQFWRDTVAPRASRNAIQVLLPVLLLAAGGHITGLTLLGGLAAVVLAAAASVLKTLSGALVDETAPAWQQIAERSAGSAAGAVAALWPLDLTGAVHADWASIGVTAAGAAALSVATWFVQQSQATVSAARTYGLLPTTYDPRDYWAHPTAFHDGTFIDLTAGFPEDPYDQLALGSCVSNGVAGIMDYARVKSGLAALRRPARLFLYWCGRVLGKYPTDQDTGLEIRDGLAAAAKFGAPPETEWPYDINKFAVRPPAEAYADGAHDEALVYGQVSPADIDHVIAGGAPVVFGFTVYSSFEGAAIARTGVMPVPDRKREKNLGGHCVVAVSTPIDGSKIPGGTPGVLYRKCRNSWGTSWGAAGYFWMPVAVFDQDASDFWQITTVGDPAAPQPSPDPGPVARFPGELVAAVQAAADDPAVGVFLSDPHTRAIRAVAAHLRAILTAPRA